MYVWFVFLLIFKYKKTSISEVKSVIPPVKDEQLKKDVSK